VVKGFKFPLDYALYDLSYANLILLGATLPSYDSEKNKKSSRGDGEVIKADDPKNREKVKQFFNSVK
jgi:hypothetical protein